MADFVELLSDDFKSVPSLSDRLRKASNRHITNPQLAIREVLHSPECIPPGPILTHLRFTQDILVVTNNIYALCKHILHSIEPRDSLIAVAKAFFGGQTGEPRIDGVSEADDLAFRGRFFETYPMAVMLALWSAPVANAKFKVDEQLKQPVAGLMEQIVLKDLNLSTVDLAALADAHSFPAVESRDKAVALVKAMRRLSDVVTDPEDVPRLINKGFLTSRQIAVQTKNRFLQAAKAGNIDQARALKIHDHAERIECRNEHLWLALVQDRRRNFDPVEPLGPLPAAGTGDPSRLKSAPSKSQNGESKGELDINSKSRRNLTDIFRLQASACDQCCSVTSLSAYFVDLMRFHGSHHIDGTKRLIDETAGTDNPTPLDRLLERRPDLQNLELSCANCEALIPYVNLVNEVLESFISYHSSPPDKRKANMIEAFNSSPEDRKVDGHGGEQLRPGNINLSVYEHAVSKQMFPFSVFPYDMARDAIENYFSSCGMTLLEVAEVFQSPASLLKDVVIPRDADQHAREQVEFDLQRGVKEVLDRQSAAEVLNLQHQEFAAITRQTFYPSWFSDLTCALSVKPAAAVTSSPWTTAGLWGYSSGAHMLEASEERGLSFIREQFMPRAGLSFQETLDLCRTQLFGQDLVINNSKGSQIFTGEIAELRLRCGATAPPFQPLTEGICADLQAFLRLRSRLGWTIKELDAAVICFRQLDSTDTSPKQCRLLLSPDAESTMPISVAIPAGTLKSLAWAVRLSKVVGGLAVSALLPLWGDIDTYGESSLYHQLFLKPHVLHIDPVFRPPASGAYLRSQTALNEHEDGICASLDWPVALFYDLVESAKESIPERGRAVLNISSLSALYRHALVCKLLSIPPELCQAFFLVFNAENANVFRNPECTFHAVKRWKRMFDHGWNVRDILRIVSRGEGSVGDTVVDYSPGLRIATAISDGAVGVAKALAFVQSALCSSEGAAKVANRVFDATTAEPVIRFVEGRLLLAHKYIVANGWIVNSLVRSAAWPPTLSVASFYQSKDGELVDLVLNGVVTEAQLKWLAEALEGFPTILESIRRLVRGHMDAWRAVSTRFRLSSIGPTADKSLTLLRDNWPTLLPARDRPHQMSLGRESCIRQRRNHFVRLALPALRNDLMENLVLSTMKDAFPDQDSGVMALLLSDMIRLPASSTTGSDHAQVTAKGALLELATPELDAEEPKNCSSYFRPHTTERFTFHLVEAASTTNGELPKLSVNGIEVDYYPGSRSWEPFRMTGGQLHLVQGNVPVSLLQWSTSKSLPSSMSENSPFSKSRVERAATIHTALSHAVEVIKTLRLSVEELQYMGIVHPSRDAGAKMMTFDFGSLTFDHLCALQDYQELRKRSSSGPGSLTSLFSWISEDQSTFLQAQYKTRDGALGQIAKRIASATGWKQKRLLLALNSKYPNMDTSVLLDELRSLEALLALERIILTDEAIARNSSAVSPLPFKTLFELAMPPKSLSTEASFRLIESNLQLCEHSIADASRLVESQRRALVNYLLHQNYIKKEGIHDADGLFGYFLIDVQMGAQLRTTRMKQAVSTVQLFAQRCILGLEKGISKTCLPRKKWEWMQQFHLWEANRKLILYPENWIDPTLRDDKTELFKALESNLMQKDLSKATFGQAIKTYVSDLNNIAGLDIEAYLLEPRPDEADIFHFFGRTRSAPYQFFYRSLRIARPTHKSYWQPWVKIDLDIISVDKDWNGSSLTHPGAYLVPFLCGSRLLLFTPQITLQTVLDASSENLLVPKEGTLGGAKMPAGTFGSLISANVSDSRTRKRWDVKMGWTELINGQWGPKRVSSVGLEVAEPLPPIDSFRFHPFLTFDGVQGDGKGPPQINVEVRSMAKGASQSKLNGVFYFYNDQVSASSSTSSTDASTATTFQKIKATSPFQNAIDNVKYPFKSSTQTKVVMFVPEAKPTFTGKDPLRASHSMTWTLSFPVGHGNTAPKDPVALVMSSETTSGHSSTWFARPKDDTSKTRLTHSTVAHSTELVSLDHGSAGRFMQAIAGSPNNALQALYDEVAGVSPDSLALAFGSSGSPGIRYHELDKPFALYNWEIGLHAVLLAMDRFAASQQFQEALEVARLVFDPTADFATAMEPGGTASAKKNVSCWRFPPFRDIAAQDLGEGERWNFNDNVVLDVELEMAVSETQSHGALVHAAARGRPTTYMKWTIMKYVEVLIASGDVHFRKGTLESLPLATQQYVEALHVLGPEPPTVPKLGRKEVRTFATYKSLSDGEVDFELSLPFSCELVARGSKKDLDGDAQQQNLRCFVRSGYFCVPLNPQFKKLRNLVNERLFNARNSLDIQGRPVTYSILEPSIDPAALIALSKNGLVNQNLSDGLTMIIGDRDSPMPTSRFEFLVRRALEICSELRSMGDRFLSAIERREAEVLNNLRAAHTTATHNMMLSIKSLQSSEIQKTAESLRLNRASQVSQLEFFLQFIGESPSQHIPSVNNQNSAWNDLPYSIPAPTSDDLRMSPHEKMEMDLTLAATVLSTVANGLDALAAPLNAVPTISTNIMPMGVGPSISVGGSNLAAIPSGISGWLKGSSVLLSESAARAARTAALTRQLQERRFQANIRGREIMAIQKQLEIQEVRLAAHEREMELQRREIKEAESMEAWLKTKYTNEQLYGWMERTMREMHYQAYVLAVGMARRAEAALAFEMGRGQPQGFLKPGGYWDGARDGLLAADALYLDLKRMEVAHAERRFHDFEISKTVSLRQVDPLALLKLRMTGKAQFELTEMGYDVDYPGHYMRRLKTVAVTIPAVVGPFTNLNATLTLTKHRYRVQARASTAEDYLNKEDRDAFRTDYIPISSIAVSSGSHDSGVFELDFRGERLMPFEGAGAISAWRLELPEIRQFDYETISDVVLHVMYTSVDGGIVLKNAATQAVQMQRASIKAQGQTQGFHALFDIKSEFANAWRTFKAAMVAQPASQSGKARMPLGNLQERLPFWSRQSKLKVTGIILVFGPDSRELDGKLAVSVVPRGTQVTGSIPLGKCTTRSYANLDVASLDGWFLEVAGQVQEPGDRVYIMIQYVFI
ncbi:hypothetical protein QBC34DRAFT_294729 [Podospora aff. communis PSN243]|uniref:Uncharacterized protein n=1 Tax=Podospora aff. communis PSN243 TaxID=3040156 RepID=A0AAV9GUN0_9PEZI|nr:hypothetical protein QBC34DRAFT_294729 [Podospora aff. communis PSN243]